MPDKVPYDDILEYWDQEALIPFLGAAVCMVDRDKKKAWSRGSELPNGTELAHELARRVGYKAKVREKLSLPKVAQYALKGDKHASEEDKLKALRHILQELLVTPCKPNRLHNLLAGRSEKTHLFVTTNYDSLLERAMGDRKFDVIFHAPRNQRGPDYFGWLPSGESQAKFRTDIELARMDFTGKTVIFKMHGTVSGQTWDDFVIAEDDYTSYLSHMPIPTMFFPAFVQCSFLFLGCSLEDPNLRVLLVRLKKPRGRVPSWAIQLKARESEQWFWRDRGIRVIDANLNAFVQNFPGVEGTKPSS